MAKKGGRLSNEVRDQKMAQGKDLYIKGYSVQTIAEILDISVDTVNKWKREAEWEAEKELYSISPTEIKSLILQNVRAIKEGRELPYKADDIAKLTAAFDKISDNRREVVFTMESFGKFSDWLLEKAIAKKGKQREAILSRVKEIRALQDEYVNELLDQV